MGHHKVFFFYGGGGALYTGLFYAILCLYYSVLHVDIAARLIKAQDIYSNINPSLHFISWVLKMPLAIYSVSFLTVFVVCLMF